jgi:HSP20 family protein
MTRVAAAELDCFSASEIGQGYSLVFDVKQVDGDLVFEADVPGVDADALSVSLTGNLLKVSGMRAQAAEGETYYLYEREHGPFTRSFLVPDAVDRERIEVRLERGVLRIVVPTFAE